MDSESSKDLLNAEIKQLKEELTNANANVESLENFLNATDERNKRYETTEKDEVQAALAANKIVLASETEKNTKLEATLKERNADLEFSNNSLRDKDYEFTQLTKYFTEAKAGFESSKDLLNAEIKELKEDLRKARENLESSKNSLNATEEQNKQYEKDLTKANIEFMKLLACLTGVPTFDDKISSYPLYIHDLTQKAIKLSTRDEKRISAVEHLVHQYGHYLWIQALYTNRANTSPTYTTHFEYEIAQLEKKGSELLKNLAAYVRRNEKAFLNMLRKNHLLEIKEEDIGCCWVAEIENHCSDMSLSVEDLDSNTENEIKEKLNEKIQSYTKANKLMCEQHRIA